MLSGFMQIVVTVLLMAGGMGMMLNPSNQDALLAFLILVLAVASISLGVIVVAGALKMRKLKNYRFCRMSIILAMLPLGAGFFFGLPFGVWGLLALRRADVKAAFALNDNRP
jgi:hypothetical protein